MAAGLRDRMTRIRAKGLENIESSVIRRGLVFLVAVAPAQAFNLALIIAAEEVLDARGFGVFFLANSIINILFAASVILGFHMSRNLVYVQHWSGTEECFGLARYYLHLYLKFGVPIGLAIVVTLTTLSVVLDRESSLLAVMIGLSTYVWYIADFGRVVFQSLKRFRTLAFYNGAMLATRFVMCISALIIFVKPSFGVLGIFLGGALVAIVFVRWLLANPYQKFIPGTLPSGQLTLVVLMALSYGAFVALTYLDLLIVYLTFPKSYFDVFATSVIIPKMLLMLTMPLVQVMFPMIATHAVSSDSKTRGVLMRSLVLSAVLGTGLAAMTVLTSGLTCGSSYGLDACDPHIMEPVAWASAGLILLRTLLLGEYALLDGKTFLILIFPGFVGVIAVVLLFHSPEIITLYPIAIVFLCLVCSRSSLRSMLKLPARGTNDVRN